MNYDYIYNLAFKYREARLRKKLSAHMPLALRLKDGRTAYISIVGEMGEYNAVVIGLNDQGYYLLDKLLKNNILSNDYVKFANIFEGDFIQMGLGKKSYLNGEELERVTAYKKKNKLKLKGPLTFPYFRKSREFAQSIELKDEEDFKVICQVLNALLSLDKMLKENHRRELGIGYTYEFEKIPLMTYEDDSYILKNYIEKPKNIKVTYPHAKIINIDTIRKLKEIPKNISFNMKLIPTYNMGVSDGKLYQPLLLAPFVDGLDLTLVLDLSDSPEDYPDKIVNDFLEVLVEEETNPSVINAYDKRTYDLFKNVCSTYDIGIKLIEEDRQIKDFEAELHDEYVATYFNDEIISEHALLNVMQAIEKLESPESIEITYEEILEQLEFFLHYSNLPYVEMDERAISSVKEAIKDLKEAIRNVNN